MKKPTAVQIAIPEPCTQAWEDMQPIAGGRHCAHCQRVVVDFTRMTDAQLLEYFSKGNTSCGRFAAEQLDRVIQPVDILQSNWWTRIAAGLLLALGFSKEVSAQNREKPTSMEQISTSSFHPLKSLEEMGPEDCKLDHIQTISITGILKDLDDNVISNAQVRIYGEAGDNLLSETKTDTNGRYSISAILANGLYFVAFSNGYTEARYKRVFLANPMVQLDGYLRIKSLPPIVTGMPLPTMR